MKVAQKDGFDYFDPLNPPTCIKPNQRIESAFLNGSIDLGPITN
jgi:hypothetical protein